MTTMRSRSWPPDLPLVVETFFERSSRALACWMCFTTRGLLGLGCGRGAAAGRLTSVCPAALRWLPLAWGVRAARPLATARPFVEVRGAAVATARTVGGPLGAATGAA